MLSYSSPVWQTAAPLKDERLCGNQRAKETAEGAAGIFRVHLENYTSLEQFAEEWFVNALAMLSFVTMLLAERKFDYNSNSYPSLRIIYPSGQLTVIEGSQE